MKTQFQKTQKNIRSNIALKTAFQSRFFGYSKQHK